MRFCDAAAGNMAVHADAYGHRSEDYRIPSSPYLFDPTRRFNGRQPNSFARPNGGSVGTSWIGQEGFVGFAINECLRVSRSASVEPVPTVPLHSNGSSLACAFLAGANQPIGCC